MNFTELTDYAHQNTEAYIDRLLQPDRQGKGYICPICDNGAGATGDGIKTQDGIHYKCFKCGFYGDIIDLIGIVYNKTDNTEKLRATADYMGVELQGTAAADFKGVGSKASQNQDKSEQYTHTHTHTHRPAAAEPDLTAFFIEAHKNIDKTTYHRGLSKATLDAFNIGYVEKWRHPKAPASVPETPRLIIPTGKGSYLARDTRSEIPEEQQKYAKSKCGKVLEPFNAEALYNIKGFNETIIIVEGEIDALSVIEAGGEAVALGSTSYVKKFLKYIEDNGKPIAPLIICLDNDTLKEGEEETPAQRATRELEEGLTRLNVPFYSRNVSLIPEEYKDANEALIADREILEMNIAAIDLIPEAERDYLKKQYIQQNSTASYINDFIDGIAEGASTPAISTGFTQLDEELEGGLYEGLYIIGAISSLGKTTLTLQIADQIAAAGKDVLIFSLEMARAELMAKSISRHTIITTLATGGDTANAKTARGIMAGDRYAAYSPQEKALIHQAVIEYKRYAKNLYILEGQGDIAAADIRAAVERHKDLTGNSPIVIVDYLQIIAPHNERATEKQAADKAVLELKRISRDYKTPVIAISSFNRDNYKAAVSMQAFKESGGIEYSSDVLIGLQLKGAGAANFDADEAKAKNPREVELVILKNRNGRAGVKCNYLYYPLFNYFTEE